jgi:peptidoglycan/LPS O-acetylase OafA/YrhL
MINLNTRELSIARDGAAEHKPPKIHSLTSMRFFAALYVVAYHTFGRSVPDPNNFLNRFVDLGFVGVSFFFLLSGYVLSIVYLQPGSKFDSLKFFRARFARIYPLFFVTLLADIPNVLLTRIRELGLPKGISSVLFDLVTHLVLVHAWFPRFAISMDSPNWSLSAEMFFYLCFPLLGLLLWRIERRSSLFWAAFVVFACGQILVRIGSLQGFGRDEIRFSPILHLSTFVLGIMLARWQTLGPVGKRDRSNGTRYIALAFAFLSFLIVVYFASELAYGNLFDGLLAPVFMCFIGLLSHQGNKLSELLSHRWLVLLGDASFGLYLIHMVVRHYFDHLDNLHLIDFHNCYWRLTYMALCVFLSIASYMYLEGPSREVLLNRFHTTSFETAEQPSVAP